MDEEYYDDELEEEPCVFCEIINGEEPSVKVMDSDDFLVIQNKYPTAPIHVLVVDKQHREKVDTLSGKYKDKAYWDKMFEVIYQAVKKLELDKTGYKLVNNGAGYNHFEHEHFHILGGTQEEPSGTT